jgi:adenosylcobinamide-GDP ribazoletransferase
VAFLAAITFLTAIPLPIKRSWEPRELADSRLFFPLVGLILGGILAGMDWAMRLLLPLPVASALLLAGWVLLTGGIHLDGLMDTCDGVFGGKDPSKRLEIMADPRVGSFGVAGGVLMLLVKWSCLAALAPSLHLPSLLAVPVFSRWGMVLAMALFPYVRAQGTGVALRSDSKLIPISAGAMCLGLSWLLLGRIGAGLAAGASVLAWGLGRWLMGLLGGLTGDTYGAINEVIEAAALVAIVAIANDFL